MRKRTYLTNSYANKNGIVLVAQYAPSLAEAFCLAYMSNNKRVRAKSFDGFYHCSGLKAA